MNAKEAREKAHNINIDSTNSQYAKVKDVIKKAVNDGKYATYYYEGLKGDVSDKLESEGFKITLYSDFRNEKTLTISW
jgi:hypothetical protein